MDTAIKGFFLFFIIAAICATIINVYEIKDRAKACEVCKTVVSEFENVKAENLKIGKELDAIITVNLELAKELHKEGIIPLEYFYNIQHNFKMIKE